MNILRNQIKKNYLNYSKGNLIKEDIENLDLHDELINAFFDEFVKPNSAEVLEYYTLTSLPLLIVDNNGKKIAVYLDVIYGGEIAIEQQDTGIEDDFEEAIRQFALDNGAKPYIAEFKAKASREGLKESKDDYRRVNNGLRPTWIKYKGLKELK
jgi:hypothetical protein